MSKLLSLKMNEEIFEETEKILKKIHKPRNAYINEAVAKLNRYYKGLALKKQLRKDAKLSKKDKDTQDFLKDWDQVQDLFE